MLQWLTHTLRGMCMGVADAIPGVSGGTLALILGIYERFIGAVSAIGPAMLLAMTRKTFWRALVKGLTDPASVAPAATESEAPSREQRDVTYAGHALFLGFLGVGIAAAGLTVVRIVPTLLSVYPAQTKAFFFGLVAASVAVPFKHMRTRTSAHYLAAVVAAVGTFFLVGLPTDASNNATGEVTMTFAAPTEAEQRVSAANVAFLTAKLGGDAKSDKREVAFGPKSDLLVPAGTTTLTVPVVARMSGRLANLEPGSLKTVRGVEGATVSQAGPMAGGVDPALWFIFLVGAIAISAMVLPGISGSFLLLMFGLYHYVTFNLRLAVYDRDAEAMVVVGVFLAAVALGILTFTRLLKWLLARGHDLTMAALVGLMVGSLRKLWPYTQLQDGVESNTLPTGFDGTVALTLGLAVAGAIVVLGLERLGSKHQAA